MEIKRKYRILIAFVSLFILLSLIQESYAKYVTTASADANMTIARWNILVNSQDILSNNNFSNTIVPVFPGNTHTSSGIIAPLSEGYFDLVINYSEVDTSFIQKIKLTHANNNTITDLKIVGYKLNNNNIVNFTSTTEINREILLNSGNGVDTYRIYLKWIDGLGETMNNEDDTNATIDGIANIKVEVTFTQKAS